MGKLYDQLKQNGYDGSELEQMLVRLLFCLFAEDTNIFEKGTFCEIIELQSWCFLASIISSGTRKPSEKI